LPVRRIGQRRRATRAPSRWLSSGAGPARRPPAPFPAGSPKALNARPLGRSSTHELQEPAFSTECSA
jgi:hypothetical protein